MADQQTTNLNLNGVKHGWYSQKMASRGFVVIYATPDGQEVRVTDVTYSKRHNLGWDDVVYVGPVTRFIQAESDR